LVENQQRLFLSSYFLILVIFLSGCSSSNSQSNGSTFEQPAGFQVTPSTALVEAGQNLQFIATGDSGSLVSPVWNVNGVAGGSATVGTITSSGLYTAPTSAPSGSVLITMTNTAQNATTSPAQVSVFSPKSFAAGTVSTSNNPQVALYTITAPVGATAQIQFGTTTNYGLTTWSQPAPAEGGPVSLLVAGMRANTTYHMQAVLQLASGGQTVDADHLFTTGDLPADLIPSIAVLQPAGTGAAPGVELLDLIAAQNQLVALATDLEGNVVWYYKMNPTQYPFPIKLLPNGNMLLVAFEDGNAFREVDLAGNTLFQLQVGDINTGLTKIGASFQILIEMHHDILKLPNGHYLLLGNYFPALPGGGLSTVLGDALVEWDPKAQIPVWTWSTFDHIPLTHAPNGTADWTHANAVVYSPDDGNLILSMRNQNWVVKINYQDGAGDGRILWHLGPDGDFTLPPGQAPIEWNYGQHYPTFVSPNTAGIFQLMFFNNGNGRLVDASNDVCGTPGFTPCYSSVPVFELNESAKTGQVLREINLSPHYSICCGDALTLPNGNIEYDVAFDVNTPNQSFIQEVTEEPTPQLLWQMNVTGQLMYRGFRIPSLYPGVAWSQSAIAAASVGATAQKRPVPK
jgi:arylsulfate sulfotransferase